MPRVRDMQGVPAQVTTLKSDGVRRHPAHCIFAEGKGTSRCCTCPHSPVYLKHCKSAAKCDFYEKNEDRAKEKM